MHDQHNYNCTPRENFLMSLLRKTIREYKALLDFVHKEKPFKITEISKISTVPGETEFVIQLTNKSSVLRLTAAEIIHQGYKLHDFNMFHGELIRQAAKGSLIEYLNLNDIDATHKIIAKKFDREIKQYIFTIENAEKNRFIRTAEELARDKILLSAMDFHDVFDVGYTQGSETIIKEKAALLLAKHEASENKNLT